MVAVFDTAFHRDLPAYAYSYALPHDVVERHHIRRYGFHGLAHRSSTELYAQATGKPVDRTDLVTLHLGNGCSAAAIRGGRSVDTSMGFTPLEGLVMGTRCGDIDPALVGFLARESKLSCDDIDELLNHRSGLAGMSGCSSDMAELLRSEQAGHAGAHLAIETFCYRARKYIGAYLAVLGQVDAVIFSGGIGEHAPEIRERICRGMQWCGLLIDHDANQALNHMEAGMIRRISRPEARIAVFVAAVDEEAAIAQETFTCLVR
jgi:acetate kinase